MAIKLSEEVLDEILKDYQGPDDFFKEDGIWKNLQKQLLERALGAEMTNYLGYKKNEKGKNPDNARNGTSKKTIQTENGPLELDIPRDRNGEFEPLLIGKGERRIKGLDDKIIALYSRGMSVRDIQEALKDLYTIEVSPDLISDITNSVMELVREWQKRPLDQVYPIVYFDALRVNIRHEGTVKNKSIYLALGVDMEGNKELLGMWIEETEGARFWMTVMSELCTRGLKDILIACVDGLKGFDEAIHAVYPDTEIQLCIVHMLRNSMKYVADKDRVVFVADLKKVYRAVSLADAETALKELENKWNTKYPIILKSWKSNWVYIIPFFKFSPEIRKVIYTTNAIESLNRGIRKVIKTKAILPNDDAAFKLVYLVVRNLAENWSRPILNWGPALQQFRIYFGDRVKI